ncbi:hypothetical protein FIBSPDRAFT_549230 [Athelia psychrophila]|uniref:Uncharacterized protein n=1 Tax=Athelia psychrophila TaxID=1759441 RepID=A0A166URH4_9AGAM|nr:hypothetical protein FIBSPDRAFT_549230 [Fibularhizoctonia sp. CBS 109695]
MHSNRPLHSRRSWDGSFINDSSSSPLLTAPSSPIFPSTPSSSWHRASNAIRTVFKPSHERSQNVPQMGSAQKESEMWGKYGTITFPTNSYLHTRNKQTSSPTMTGTPTSYTGTSPDRNRYDSHTSGKRHDFIPPLQSTSSTHTRPAARKLYDSLDLYSTGHQRRPGRDSATPGASRDSLMLVPSSKALLQPQRVNTGASTSTSDATMLLAVRLLSNVHSLAFEVANLIDDIAVPSELAAMVAEDSRKLTAASQSQGYSGPIEVVQSLYRDLHVLRQILITPQASEIDQEPLQKPLLACQKSLKEFSKAVPRPSTTSSKRWLHHGMAVQQDRP